MGCDRSTESTSRHYDTTYDACQGGHRHMYGVDVKQAERQGREHDGQS